MKKAKSIDGKEFDLKEAWDHETWIAEKGSDEIMLLDKDSEKIVSIRVETLIICWLEKEQTDYDAVHATNDGGKK